MTGDKQCLLRIHADLIDAIRKVLDRHADEGCYWHTPGLESNMAANAMHTLTTVSNAAQWGKENV